MPEISFGQPMSDDIEAWARRIVAAHGDGAYFYGDNGLLVEAHNPDTFPIVAREVLESASGKLDSDHRIVRSIQTLTYPNHEFGVPFWSDPNRTWDDAILQSGGNTRPAICLPSPLTEPTLVRVVMWCSWVPEEFKSDINVTLYTLFNLRPALAFA